MSVVTFTTGAAFGASGFTDIAGNTHANSIEAIYAAGITLGCSDGPNQYCPNANVSRAQMASFLARTAGLSYGANKNFPVANGRSDAQVYCALAYANNRSYDQAPCRASKRDIDTDNVGGYTSIAIGADGRPVISYYKVNSGDLRVAVCSDRACAGPPAAITTLDTGGTNDVGLHTSIGVSGDGLPVVSYYDATNTALKVAHCLNPDCTGAPTITTVDNNGATGEYTSLTIGPDGFPIISYYSSQLTSLRLARCTSYACATFQLTTVDGPVGGVGAFSSVAIASDGFPIISYRQAADGQLRVAHCSTINCQGEAPSIRIIDSGALDLGGHSSIAIDPDGLPVISTYEQGGEDLWAARCETTTCATGAVALNLVDAGASGADVGWFSSIAIGSNGKPIISYHDNSNEALLFVRCLNNDCTESVESQPDNTIGGGEYSAVVMAIDGRPLISHWLSAARDLRVVRPVVV